MGFFLKQSSRGAAFAQSGNKTGVDSDKNRGGKRIGSKGRLNQNEVSAAWKQERGAWWLGSQAGCEGKRQREQGSGSSLCTLLNWRAQAKSAGSRSAKRSCKHIAGFRSVPVDAAGGFGEGLEWEQGKTGKGAAWRWKAAVQSQKVQLLTAKSSREDSKAPAVQLLGRMQVP